MLDTLLQIVAETFDVPLAEVHPDLKQEDVDTWDSQRHLELVMNIEAAFDVSLEMSEVIRMRTVADIMDILARHQVV